MEALKWSLTAIVQTPPAPDRLVTMVPPALDTLVTVPSKTCSTSPALSAWLDPPSESRSPAIKSNGFAFEQIRNPLGCAAEEFESILFFLKRLILSFGKNNCNVKLITFAQTASGFRGFYLDRTGVSALLLPLFMASASSNAAPVWLRLLAATSSGVPRATICPPSPPASGPRSMTQSA